MFWTCIRWGGTLSVIAVLLAALLLASGPEPAATPAEAPQPSKNFNL